MYNIGDFLIFKDGANKNERYLIHSIYNSYYIIHDKNGYSYTFTEKNLDDMFITLTEYRRLIIEDLL